MKRTFLNTLVCAVPLAVVASIAPAQSEGGFNISFATIDGGGGPSSGAAFSLNGTIGQPAAGAMSGGVFTVSGGFWAGVVTALGPQPALSIRLGAPVAGVNTVILSWPNPSTGYVLQQTANMSGPGGGWSDVTQTPVVNGANKEVMLQATGQVCLFRLRRL